MKKNVVFLVSLLVCIVFTGCFTLSPATKEAIAYELGRTTTIAYVFNKDKLDPQQAEAVVKVWEGFDKAADTIGTIDAKRFDESAREKISESISNAAVRKIAIKMFDDYWLSFCDTFGVDQNDTGNFLKLILAYRSGIRDAIDDYVLVKTRGIK